MGDYYLPPMPTSPFERTAYTPVTGEPVQLTLAPVHRIARGGWSHVDLMQVASWREGGEEIAKHGGRQLVWKRARQEKAFKHRELELHSGLSHPHVIAVDLYWYEEAKDAESPRLLSLLLSPYVPLTLQALKLPLSEPHAVSYTHQILTALAYLHDPSRSIAHRDLKPPNILVDPNDPAFPGGKVFICDFGCAKKIVEGERNSASVGEQNIRAPELLYDCTSYTVKVDIFALGVLLAYMLLGRPLLEHQRTHEGQKAELVRVLSEPDAQDQADMGISEGLDVVGESKSELKERIQRIFDQERIQRTPVVLSLLTDLLTFSPFRRPSAEDALQHAAFVVLHF